ncbi:DUF1566 domain-containing protein [Cysteiniphilum marinum]|uniref:Lcl C-terminal domain-containing protein n=1 Tax=Cysteiniphilum marinum TaxID=2774191 RepID=UPI00193A1C63|nr:DUF1566 domain-containing protein [Cysteiniphilum marinum]
MSLTGKDNCRSISGLPSNNIASVFASNGQVIVATDAGVALSNNLGNNWKYHNADNGLASSKINDISILSDVAYAATEGGLSISSEATDRFVQYKDTDCLLDTQTGLIWHKNGSLYAGSWVDAMTKFPYDASSSESVCGLTGWRLPEQAALSQLILGWNDGSYKQPNEYLESQGFSDLAQHSWSATESQGNPNNAEVLNMMTGVWSSYPKLTPYAYLPINDTNVPESTRPIVAIGSAVLEIEEGRSQQIVGSKITAAEGKIIESNLWTGVGSKFLDDVNSIEPTITAPAYSVDGDNEYGLVLIATDNHGITGRDITSYTITPNNDLLAIDVDNGGELIEGETGALNATASGGDEPYKYSWLSSDDVPIKHVDDSKGEASFVAPDYKEGQSNEYTFTVMVTDAAQRQQTTTTTYTVTQKSVESLVLDAGIGGKVVEDRAANLSVTVENGQAPYTYKWTNDRGITINNADQAQADFIAPEYQETNNTYEFTVVVTDNLGNTGTSSVIYEVERDDAKLFIVADGTSEGALQEGEQSTMRVNVSGGAEPYTYSWSGASGIEVNTQDQSRATFIAPDYINGNNEYVIVAKVEDALGRVNQIQYQYTVTANPELTPIANAGPDQVITEGDAITVTAKGESKGNRTIIGYEWTGSGAQYLDNKASQTPRFTAPAYGGTNDVYELNLVVVDSSGISSASSVATYTVSPDQALIPVANAGANGRVTEGQSAQLNGQGEAKGQRVISSYKWSGNGAQYLNNKNIATPQFTAPAFDLNKSNNYDLTLHVTDSVGIVSQGSTIQYSVDVDVSIVPIANAGNNQQVAEQSSFVVNASAEALGGRTIKSYHWSGNGAAYLNNKNILKPTFTAPSHTGINDSYELILEVVDSAGIRSEQSVVIYEVTYDATLYVPVANAGSSKAVTELEKVQVNGSGTPEGEHKIVSYHWSGNGAKYLNDVNSQSPIFNAPVYTSVEEKAYELTLVVTDDYGISSQPSKITVTINPDHTVKPTVSVRDDSGVEGSRWTPKNYSITPHAKANKFNRSIVKYHWHKPPFSHDYGSNQLMGTYGHNGKSPSLYLPAYRETEINPSYSDKDNRQAYCLTVTDNAGVSSTTDVRYNWLGYGTSNNCASMWVKKK